MARVVTYRNDAGGCFCQLELDSGERILISIAQAGIQIRRLALGGIIPREVIAGWSTGEVAGAIALFAEPSQPAKHPLDAIRDRLYYLPSITAIRSFCSTPLNQSPTARTALASTANPSPPPPEKLISSLEPLVNRYGAFLEANSHLSYGIPASRLEIPSHELKAMILCYGEALRTLRLLTEPIRQTLRNGYCELSRVLPEDEGAIAVAAAEAIAQGREAENWPLIHQASTQLDRIAREGLRLLHEFDLRLPPATRVLERGRR